MYIIYICLYMYIYNTYIYIYIYILLLPEDCCNNMKIMERMCALSYYHCEDKLFS